MHNKLYNALMAFDAEGAAGILLQLGFTEYDASDVIQEFQESEDLQETADKLWDVYSLAVAP